MAAAKKGSGKPKTKKSPRPTDLKSFLRADENTVTRERLLFHRFCFDMYLAAARHPYALAVLSIEVDREGFDVVFDDGDRERRIQLKAVDAKTASWKTTKRFLRPEITIAGRLGFKTTIEGVGIGGAMVVMLYDANAADLGIRYLFCDAHILSTIANGWMPQKKPKGKGRKAGSADTARDLLAKLNCGLGSETVRIPKGLFVEARGPEDLLALLELHSLRDHQWCNMLRLRLGPEYDAKSHGPVEKEITLSLEKLIAT